VLLPLIQDIENRTVPYCPPTKAAIPFVNKVPGIPSIVHTDFTPRSKLLSTALCMPLVGRTQAHARETIFPGMGLN